MHQIDLVLLKDLVLSLSCVMNSVHFLHFVNFVSLAIEKNFQTGDCHAG